MAKSYDVECEEMIKFVGLKELDPLEQEVVQRLSTQYYEKIRRRLKSPAEVIVHLKLYQTAGKGKQAPEAKRRKKYSVHVRCAGPTRVFESCNSHDWELQRAIHKSFKDVYNQLAHAFRKEVSGRGRWRG